MKSNVDACRFTEEGGKGKDEIPITLWAKSWCSHPAPSQAGEWLFPPSLQWKPGDKLLQERWITGENPSLPKGFLEVLQGPHSSICGSQGLEGSEDEENFGKVKSGDIH